MLLESGANVVFLTVSSKVGITLMGPIEELKAGGVWYCQTDEIDGVDRRRGLFRFDAKQRAVRA